MPSSTHNTCAHTYNTPPHSQHVDKGLLCWGRGEEEEEEDDEEDYSSNMAQNQLNDKPTFSEAKMLYQTTTMERQFSGYFLF